MREATCRECGMPVLIQPSGQFYPHLVFAWCRRPVWCRGSGDRPKPEEIRPVQDVGKMMAGGCN